jgi:hypothetical protein
MAVSDRNLAVVQLLLEEAGADPHVRTRVDYYETSREMAVKAGLGEIAALLVEYEKRRES